MSLPTDFSREISERVPQPGFDEVVDRARAGRRRRRTTIASGLVTAVVVAGLGWAAGAVGGGGDDASPEPARPGPTTPWDGSSEVDPRLPADVRAVLGAERVDVFDVAASGTAVAALWAACDTGASGCTNALVVQDGDDVHGMVLDGDPRSITPVPGGWLVEESSGPVVVDASGEVHAVVESGPGVTRAEPGDTAVVVGGQWRLLRGTTLIDVPVPPDDPVVLQSAYVMPDGRLAVAVEVAGRHEVAVSIDGGSSWTAGLLPVTDPGPSWSVKDVLVVGHAETLAVVALGDVQDRGAIPVLGVHTSRDAGRTWTRARGLGWGSVQESWMWPADLSSATVTATGTTYLATRTHHVVRIDPDGNALSVQLSSFDRSVFTEGVGACVVSEGGRLDRLTCSDDDGTSWSSRALPGLR